MIINKHLGEPTTLLDLFDDGGLKNSDCIKLRKELALFQVIVDLTLEAISQLKEGRLAYSTA